MFAGDVPLDAPRMSPVNARLAGLAPVLVVIDKLESPRDDIERLASALESAGVEVTRHLAEDMPHNAAMFAAYHPSGERALDAIRSFVEERLGRRS